MEEFDSLQIHDQLVVAERDQIREQFPQARHRGDVELATAFDDRLVALVLGRQ